MRGSAAACAGGSAQERARSGAELRSRHPPLKMAAPESHRHRPARTAQARSAGAYQALRSPRWGETRRNLVLRAARLSGSLASHGHAFSGRAERRARQRQGAREPSPREESGSHLPPASPRHRHAPCHRPHAPRDAGARRTRMELLNSSAVRGGRRRGGGR